MKRNKLIIVINILYVISIFLTFLFSLMGFNNRGVNYAFSDDNIIDWGEAWTISAGGYTLDDQNLPEIIEVDRDSKVFLRKTLPDDVEDINCLVYESKRQYVDILVNGELRASYNNQGHKSGSSLPYSYVIAPIKNTDAGKEVVIVTRTATFYSGNISTVYLGSEMSIIVRLIKKNIIWMAIVFVILFLGIVSLLCYVIYRKSFRAAILFLYLFWFCAFSAGWCVSQLKVRQIFWKDLPLIETISFCFFMLIPISLVSMMNIISKRRHLRVFQFLALAFILNFYIQNTLHTLFMYDYFEMQNITQLMLLSTLILSVGLAIKDYRKGLLEKSFFILCGLTCYIAGIFGETINVMLNRNHTLGGFYSLGTLSFIICILNFIFINIKLEQEKIKDAEDANRAKSKFLATMSHEIRTPINAVLGMNEMILRESSEEKTIGYAEQINESGKLLLSIINDILDFSKIESGKMDIVCVDYQLKQVLQDLVLMTKTRIKDKKIELVLDIDEKIPSKYNGDEIRIKQVLMNILTNAVKYTKSGEIRLIIKNLGITDGEITLFFAVEDTGMGIKPEDLKNIMNSSFVRFDQVKNRSIEGTGLGLSITSQLLCLMDSKLEVESEYEKGSKFYFRLRQKVVDEKPMGSIDVTDKPVASRKNRNTFIAPEAAVLAVDDINTNLLVVRELLKQYKMTVDLAESGEQCLKMCEEKKYDIILMDHMMPQMDGIETLQHLREGSSVNKKTNVAALTANAISGMEQMYMNAGFDGYLTKPISVRGLDEYLLRNLPEEKIQKI